MNSGGSFVFGASAIGSLISELEEISTTVSFHSIGTSEVRTEPEATNVKNGGRWWDQLDLHLHTKKVRLLQQECKQARIREKVMRYGRNSLPTLRLRLLVRRQQTHKWRNW